MTEINITLPDNSVKTMPTGTTSQQVADSIGSGLARAVVVARIDGKLRDLNSPLEQDCSLELFTGDTPEGHDTLLHSTAHLMAQAVFHRVLEEEDLEEGDGGGVRLDKIDDILEVAWKDMQHIFFSCLEELPLICVKINEQLL